MRRPGFLSLLFAVCLVISACGSSAKTTTTTANVAGAGGSTKTANLLPARVAAAKCLRAQGLNVPDPTAQTGTVVRMLSIIASYPAAKVQSAAKARATQLRQAFPNASKLTTAEKTRGLDELQAFATCMRSHGISSYPDPSSFATDPGGLVKAIAAVNRDSPAYEAAAPVCKTQALKDAGGG